MSNEAVTRRLVDELNQRADEATAKLRAFEQRMVEMGLGISVSVPHGGGYFGFAKYKGAWRLVFMLPDDTMCPATDCDKINRIEFAYALPALEEKIQSGLRVILNR
jgi:hypothetical protein